MPTPHERNQVEMTGEHRRSFHQSRRIDGTELVNPGSVGRSTATHAPRGPSSRTGTAVSAVRPTTWRGSSPSWGRSAIPLPSSSPVACAAPPPSRAAHEPPGRHTPGSGPATPNGFVSRVAWQPPGSAQREMITLGATLDCGLAVAAACDRLDSRAGEWEGADTSGRRRRRGSCASVFLQRPDRAPPSGRRGKKGVACLGSDC